MSEENKTKALQRHIPYGYPSSRRTAREITLHQRHFVTHYDGHLRTPLWTAHRLTRSDLNANRERKNCFRNDVRLRLRSAAFCSDYDEPVYDRGHMVPNSDMERSLNAMLNTYMFTNMAPQECRFNRGGWLVLESLVRHWVKERGTLYITTGSVFDRDGEVGRDDDAMAERMVSRNGQARVAVPSHFYKIILRRNRGNVDTLALLFEHNNDPLPEGRDAQVRWMIDKVVSIETIEDHTDITFFPGIDRSRIRQANDLWVLPQSWPRRLDRQCS